MQRGLGAVITYEGDVFPEDRGWSREGTLDADRWIDDGWFVHSMDLGAWGPPPYGEGDWYRKPLSDYAGASKFLVEWRMESDGPSSEFIGVGPSIMSLGGTTAVHYQVITAKDRVQFWRDNTLPILEFGIDGGVAHTYRIELDGASWYSFSVDGVVMDQGVPEGTYPSDSSTIVWGGQYYLHHNTNRWDYITFGNIPEPSSALLLGCGGALVHRRRKLRSATGSRI